MFTVDSNYENSYFFIRDYAGSRPVYLHCDGRVINVREYFETAVAAQKVLDKFQPEPKHEWKHGDVFESGHPSNPGIMMYVKILKARSIIYLKSNMKVFDPIQCYLDGANFLFNIEEKI